MFTWVTEALRGWIALAVPWGKGNDVSGVGNTEREEVVEDDDFDEDEDTETELVTEERTEEAVAEVEEVIDTDELPVVGVGVVEVLQNIIVSQR